MIFANTVVQTIRAFVFRNVFFAFTLLAFQLAYFPSKAQIPKEPVSVKSPNVASLGLFGEVPVSHFTGVASIDIPLYTVVDKKLSVPISLSYHASGFRPDVHPGWVGMGWNLSAGGTISRTIRDIPDEWSPAKPNQTEYPGFYYNYAVLNPSNWDQESYMRSIAETNASLYDTEPDEFSFNFPGFNGKFYLDHNRKWKVKCNRPVKVTFNDQFLPVPFTIPSNSPASVQGNIKSFAGFTITDDKGNQYIFGGTTNAIEYSIGFFIQDEDWWFADAWHLVKIISAEGYEINLSYERDNFFINEMYISLNGDIKTKVDATGIIQPGCSSSTLPIFLRSFTGKLISPVYLKSITAANCKVDFKSSKSTELKYDPVTYAYQLSQYGKRSPFLPYISSPRFPYPESLDKLQWRKLDEVIITENHNTRTLAFTYNNIATQRLKLLSLQEKSSTSNSKPPYQFFYDESKPLPMYLAHESDHWGFYNGTFPDFSSTTYYLTYFAAREPNPEFLYAGTLNKIIYPTGGITDFVYEPHKYSKRLQVSRSAGIDPTFNTNTIAGGLRIKKVITYDPATPGVKNTKEYFYVRNYTNQANVANLESSGVLGGQTQYYYENYRSKAFNDNVVYSKSLFSSQSVLPASSNSQGSHIGYSEVVEKNSDGGYTRFFYTNFEDGHLDEAATSIQLTRTAYEPYTSLEEERGLLKDELQFNNVDKLLRKRTITYTALNKSNQFVRGMSAEYSNVCSNTAVAWAEGFAYKNYTYSNLPDSETETVYSTDGIISPFTNTSTLTYDPNYRLVKESTTLKSNGDILKTVMPYPSDYPSNTVYQAMVAKNIVAPVIEETKYVVKGTTSEKISLLRTNYYSPVAGKYFPQTIEAQTLSNPIETRFRFHGYDDFGNLLTSSPEGGTKTGYQWSYNGQFPEAKVINASNTNTLREFFFEGFENMNHSNAVIGKARTGTKYWQSSYTTAFTIPNARSYKISWWTLSNNTWTYSEQAFTGNISLTGPVDDIRIFPADAQMTTYTYSSMVGMTSQTDARNTTMYFEYDIFGRLDLVRDLNGNVIKKYCYNYKGERTDCMSAFGNDAMSKTYIRNNCPPNNEGEELTYSLPILQETAAVQFENYLRANFGETVMRTHYLLEGTDREVADKSVNVAKAYKLPLASYMKLIGGDRPASRHSDGTAIKSPSAIADSRKFKF